VKSVNIKSYCKINLSLKIIKKLNNGYHKISSLITFCNLHDVISITKTKTKDCISFSGPFKKHINNKENTVTRILHLLRKNRLLLDKKFIINIKKNIPHGSGLGGGSANAASILNYLNDKMMLKLRKKNMEDLANQIGFDVPISLKKKNTFLTGKSKQIIRLKQKFKLNILVVYPNFVCSTKQIYQEHKVRSSQNLRSYLPTKNNKRLIDFLKNASNDLEKTVVRLYPKVKQVIDAIKSQKGCHFSRITGSGSACIGIFSNPKKAINAQKMIKLKYPKYWCVTSKTI